MFSFVVLIALGIGLAALMFFAGRKIASGSAVERRRVLRLCAVSAAAGLALSVWLPHYVPETPGSPGTIVMMLVLWLVGGPMALFGIFGWLGAYFAPAPPDAGK